MNIKTITTTKLRDNLEAVLDNISLDQLYIITRPGKASLAIVDLGQLEDLLAADDPSYLKQLAKARKQAAAGEVFTIEEVFGDL